MHTATIVFQHPKADVIESTIRPEIRGEFQKTSVKICRQDDELSITIESSDVNGLRAAVNSYLRWMNMAVTIVDKIGG
ncbi:MAG: KEOPS complex subunit Pcc1 [Thermoplasmata archaeon]|nr:KEOPS complex subunit Pcc1 [Thermoplasmata archaeon]